MAQPALDLFRKRGLALKLRASADTPVVPSTSANGILLLDGSSGTEIDQIERNVDRAYLGASPFVIGNKRAFIEGDFELYPPATPGAASTSDADCGALLLPAGMAVVKDDDAKTTRYNPISTAMALSDAYWWHSGTHKQVLACRHNITQLGIAIGERFKGHVRVQGDYTDIAEEALPAITLPTTVPVAATAANSTCKIDVLPEGTPLTVWGKSFTLDFGNTITRKEYSSHAETGISDRRPNWTLRIARTAKADFDPWAVRDAGTPILASWRLTQGGLLYTEIGVRGQIETINEIEIDGDYGFELSGRAVPDGAGTEFYLEFGDATP